MIHRRLDRVDVVPRNCIPIQTVIVEVAKGRYDPATGVEALQHHTARDDRWVRNQGRHRPCRRGSHRNTVWRYGSSPDSACHGLPRHEDTQQPRKDQAIDYLSHHVQGGHGSQYSSSVRGIGRPFPRSSVLAWACAHTIIHYGATLRRRTKEDTCAFPSDRQPTRPTSSVPPSLPTALANAAVACRSPLQDGFLPFSATRRHPRARHPTRAARPEPSSNRVAGSGTAVDVGVKVRSSRVKEAPDGSPVMVMWSIPAAKATLRCSLGALPTSPERAGFDPKAEVTELTLVFEPSNAVRVSCVV